MGIRRTLGVAGALGLTGVLGSLLFQVQPTDPTTFAVVAALLVGVGLVASWIPTLRGTRVDPRVTMRAE